MTLAARLHACGATLGPPRIENGRVVLDMEIAFLIVTCSGIDLNAALGEVTYWLDELRWLTMRTGAIDVDCCEMAEAPRYELGGSD